MPRYGIQLNRKTLVKWSRHRWKRQGRMVARWYALVPEPVKRIVRIITDAVTFAPSPLSSSLVDISIRLIGVIGHGILSRWLATSLRVYTSYIRADDNRYTTHIYARRAIRPWPRNNCPILSIRSATPSLRCRLPPLFQNEGKGAGEGDRNKVTNRYPNLELTLT